MYSISFGKSLIFSFLQTLPQSFLITTYAILRRYYYRRRILLLLLRALGKKKVCCLVKSERNSLAYLPCPRKMISAEKKRVEDVPACSIASAVDVFVVFIFNYYCCYYCALDVLFFAFDS